MEPVQQGNPLRRVANFLTLFRAISGAPLIFLLSTDNIAAAWFLLLLGALSDFADGALARRADSGNKWGAKLDPLADKILLFAPLIWLTSKSVLPIWAIWIFISRETLISSWRSEHEKGGPASLAGKAKTIFLFVSMLLLLWPTNWGNEYIIIVFQKIGFLFFWFSFFAAILSAFKYLSHQSKLHH